MEKKINDDNENHNKDIEYLFVQAAAADIRTLSETERCMIKHEINNSIFKHQMKKFRSNAFPNTVMTNTNYSLQASDFNSNDELPRISSRALSNRSWESNSHEKPSLASPESAAPHGYCDLMTRKRTIAIMGYTQ